MFSVWPVLKSTSYLLFIQFVPVFMDNNDLFVFGSGSFGFSGKDCTEVNKN